ncbi:uncharacterized protein [Lolium perenne]|uniref:uncharacterized protein n=1 Tax=Lolium perenne TaxID=4522 RepID=UPI0021F63CF5|nr:uncharacterized protein LOC127348486 [Lolium perenne]
MGGCVGVAGEVDDPVEEVASEVPPGLTAQRCVAFQWEPDGKYLRYSRQGKEEGAVTDGLLQLDGEDVTSPHTRFFLEPSKEHDGQRLLHVRCCYDNKYLAAVQGPHSGGGAWIIGATDEAEEDLSKATCTLFKTTASDRRPGYVRFVHAHLGMYACMSEQTLRLSLQEGDGLDAASGHGDIIIHDLSRSLVLPRYLVFKGDNGMYLRPRIIGRQKYVQFSAAGAADQSLVNTVHGNQDGTFRVWSNHFGKFWRRSPNWIFCDSDAAAAAGDVDTLFRATRFGSSVALQNLGNNWYCKRLTTEGKNNCLNAGAPTITADARLRLEEAVVSREIYDVVFDLSGTRVYGKTSVVGMATASAHNDDTASSTTAELTLECRHTERRTWASSVTMSLGVTAKIHAGVPHVAAGGNMEVAEDELSGLYSWGSSMEKETRKDVAYQVTVPPKTKVTVTMVATRAYCDVPFSYKQRDTLFDGQQVTHDMNDGLYTGENCFDFEYVITSQEMI